MLLNFILLCQKISYETLTTKLYPIYLPKTILHENKDNKYYNACFNSISCSLFIISAELHMSFDFHCMLFVEQITHIPYDTIRNIHHIESLVLTRVLCKDNIYLWFQTCDFFLDIYWEMEVSCLLPGFHPHAASSFAYHSEWTSHLDHSTGLWQKQWHIHHSHAHSSAYPH